MNCRTVLLSLLCALIPAPAFALPFKFGDYICPRDGSVEIRAGIAIERGSDPTETLKKHPPEQRAVLGTVAPGECMVVVQNQANGFKSGGYTWYNVHRSSLHGWTAGELYNWSGNLLAPEQETDDSVVSDASSLLKSQ
ncbi:MAG: hypothetical protein WA902_19460 [Thermosynechococcaceae cyanobacterium]